MFHETTFGSRILKLRKQSGLSQRELGERIGLSHKAISTIESGTRGTTIDKVVALAEHFRVSTDYLLGLTDDPTWRGAADDAGNFQDRSEQDAL